MAPSPKEKIKIAIDRGGTFTDCIGICEGHDDIVIKLLSEDPQNYEDGSLEGVRRIMEKFTGQKLSRNQMIPTAQIDSIRMGTTVATNALLERKGEKCAFVTTKGFRDLLIIGNQARPQIFSLNIQKPSVLYSAVVEIDERVTLEDYAEDAEKHLTDVTGKDPNLVKGLSAETVRIIKKPDLEQARKDLKAIFDQDIMSISICLMHSYTFPDHERQVAQVAKEIGFKNIDLSSDLLPMIKIVPRGNSVIADTYLSPVIQKYIDSIYRKFEGGLKRGKDKNTDSNVSCTFMQSDGGLVDVSKFSGLKAILSGPAGGLVGYALTSFDPGTRTPIIGFDMGGTSTDVSRFDGDFEQIFETTIAGINIQSPQLDIDTVAAGGGSMLMWRNGMFAVGPESAGADPGPACYRKGGPLTITDANLITGRLLPEFFPAIFGPNEDESIDIECARTKFEDLTNEINRSLPEGKKKLSIMEVATGFIQVANEAICRPIRSITEARGHNIRKHQLATFGGAGGQHCCAVAKILGLNTVVIHKYSSILSAYGMLLADIVEEAQEPIALEYSDNAMAIIRKRFESLIQKTNEGLDSQGMTDAKIVHKLYLNMRYKGTDSTFMIEKPKDSWDFASQFVHQHEREYGFTMDRDILVNDIRVLGIAKASHLNLEPLGSQLKSFKKEPIQESQMHRRSEVFYEEKPSEAVIIKLEVIRPGQQVDGPAIIVDNTQSIVVDRGCTAKILDLHVVIELGQKEEKSYSSEHVDSILLSIFSHRFMAIAEQMGKALQRTSVSTNIKERLDFSCALFDKDGNLVANAPHLPVHLGSMSTAVKYQAEYWKSDLAPGDVLVCNHPATGGTHLPDITTIMPAFYDNEIVFYVAARGHHSDIGGITAGSMPPNSKYLWEEGAAIKHEKLVTRGRFNEERITELLLKEPTKYPRCSGTRNLSDNISDLKAQVSANKKGIELITNLFEEFGYDVVQLYMEAIQKNAEDSVRDLLRKFSGNVTGEVIAEDFMDDGSRIKLKVSIDKENGEATFDFSGTSSQVFGNLNAPTSVSHSAILYCMRCLIQSDIPLNWGCLIPIKVMIPPNSLLSPTETAAVVAGNVCTSQRVTDVVFKAFEAVSGSQGDCNNFVFGKGGYDSETKEYHEGFGYYETIAGGAGAGPGWDGASGVHTHMTNTRITDPEILERRYPVLLREFSLRENSGGNGLYKGGLGIVRDIEFRTALSAAILSERRVFAPYGLKGGSPGERGLNLWIKKEKTPNNNEREVKLSIGSRNEIKVEPGDRVIINTPGGGGYGDPNSEVRRVKPKNNEFEFNKRAAGSLNAWQMAAESSF